MPHTCPKCGWACTCEATACRHCSLLPHYTLATGTGMTRYLEVHCECDDPECAGECNERDQDY